MSPSRLHSYLRPNGFIITFSLPRPLALNSLGPPTRIGPDTTGRMLGGPRRLLATQ